MIGYYIHNHGRGHLTRARSIAAHLDAPVTALSSLPIAGTHPFRHVVDLARDDTSIEPTDVTAGGVLHWAPRHDRGLRTRMAALAAWIEADQPSLVVVDVSVEIAAFVRLLGIPVVVMAMPGERDDCSHALGYSLADHIIAPWPGGLYEPTWLHEHRAKTTYVGGISRFEGRPKLPTVEQRQQITVLNGAGGSTMTSQALDECAHSYSEFRWLPLGVPGTPWVEDPWPTLSASSVVVTHAGQNAIADIATSQTPAIVIAQDRPYLEQRTMARILSANSLAVVSDHWPTTTQWADLIGTARALGGQRWALWNTTGAASRAAGIIDELAARRRPK